VASRSSRLGVELVVVGGAGRRCATSAGRPPMPPSQLRPEPAWGEMRRDTPRTKPTLAAAAALLTCNRGASTSDRPSTDIRDM
jgi:hypothetical protein